jgi:hypothetical protein
MHELNRFRGRQVACDSRCSHGALSPCSTAPNRLDTASSTSLKAGLWRLQSSRRTKVDASSLLGNKSAAHACAARNVSAPTQITPS